MYSRDAVITVIFNTLDYDKQRGGHTTESLLRQMRVLGVVRSVRTHLSILQTIWTENEFRLLIAELIQAGRLDMRSDGVLIPASESEDPRIEKFQGEWYVTVNGQIKGPFHTEREATIAVSR